VASLFSFNHNDDDASVTSQYSFSALPKVVLAPVGRRHTRKSRRLIMGDDASIGSTLSNGSTLGSLAASASVPSLSLSKTGVASGRRRKRQRQKPRRASLAPEPQLPPLPPRAVAKKGAPTPKKLREADLQRRWVALIHGHQIDRRMAQLFREARRKGVRLRAEEIKRTGWNPDIPSHKNLMGLTVKMRAVGLFIRLKNRWRNAAANIIKCQLEESRNDGARQATIFSWAARRLRKHVLRVQRAARDFVTVQRARKNLLNIFWDRVERHYEKRLHHYYIELHTGQTGGGGGGGGSGRGGKRSETWVTQHRREWESFHANISKPLHERLDVLGVARPSGAAATGGTGYYTQATRNRIIKQHLFEVRQEHAVKIDESAQAARVKALLEKSGLHRSWSIEDAQELMRTGQTDEQEVRPLSAGPAGPQFERDVFPALTVLKYTPRSKMLELIERALKEDFLARAAEEAAANAAAAAAAAAAAPPAMFA